MKSKILLATDHAGFELKQIVKAYLEKENYEVQDLGAMQYDKDDDYPVYMKKVGEIMSVDTGSYKAIIFGKTGNGEAIDANRYPHVRAVVWYGGNMDVIKLSREHNDANVLSIGAGFVGENEALEAIKLWLNTDFSHEGRHERRISQID